ncbi:MAG: GNAT family N-acetyltransferase [Dehalococcoidia bacterium]
MSIEYRLVTDADYEQMVEMESFAFYNRASPDDANILRQMMRPEWTVAAFDDGKIIADVRAIPMARLMNGSKAPIAVVGPVACQAAYRRQGHAGKLLKMSLELMRERGQPLSGLYTPHDALYRRYGWERAEGKKKYSFDPGDVRLRVRSDGGHTAVAKPDDWKRLDALYRKQVADKNGPLTRNDPWWRWNLLTTFEGDKRYDRDAVVWVNAAGEDTGYAIYLNRPTGTREGGWPQQEIWIRDMVALDNNAYIGLWEHMFTHDLAANLVYSAHPDDVFQDLCEDPFVVKSEADQGPMIRIVDIERAIEMRPFVGTGSASFTMAITDTSAPWNEGTWRVEAGGGRMSAEKTDAEPDIEMSVNFLAPIYTGYRPLAQMANAGMTTVRRPEVLAEVANAFAVTDTPFTQDYY